MSDRIDTEAAAALRAALAEGDTERPATMDTGLVEVRQVRCPTCGSDDRAVRLTMTPFRAFCMNDPWHRATDTEATP